MPRLLGRFMRGYMADPNDKPALGRVRGDVCDGPPEAIVNAGVVYSAALLPVAGAGHLPFIEQPQAVLRAIQPFVTAHPPSR